MAQFRARSEMPASAEEVFAWHARPGALERLLPPWERTRVLERSGGIHDGGRVVIALHLGPAPIRWVARHTDYEPGRLFRDVQESGPFARWVHTHMTTPLTETTSTLEDSIDYEPPLGPLGQALGGPVIQAMLERQFRFRHARTRLDLERHAPYRHQAPWRIAMTGATGMLGTQLSAFLTTGGHTVVPLVRREVRPGEAAVYWDPERGVLDPADLEGFDAVIHLAGENIAGGRWTAERKARILGSREAGTRLLGETLAKLERKPRVWISASGAGFYGDRGDEVLTEASAGGRGFLADVCRAWEAGTASARDAGIRVVNLRIGVVMTPSGGALAKQLIPYELGLGGPVGSGRQYLSWIDEDDLMGVVLHALHTDSLEGPVNATSPEPVQSAGFARALGHVLHRPAVMPLPAPAVLALFGEMGQEALLEGQRVLPQRLLDTGFRFAHPNLEASLGYQLGKSV
jgi:uncharacterized protein (TIGR01777 family)